MRPTLRLLARVKSAKYLQPFNPTGLTGLATHPDPRPTLICLYKETLDKLKTIPEASVYRQATEALTRQRLNIVESVKPAGFDEWREQVKVLVTALPDAFEHAKRPDGSYVAHYSEEIVNPEEQLFEGEELPDLPNGPPQTEEEFRAYEKAYPEDPKPQLQLPPEPPLEATQVSEIENQIGAGLIEEVIQVAQGELNLVDEMIKNKVWEELEEKPKPDQWKYFERTE